MCADGALELVLEPDKAIPVPFLAEFKMSLDAPGRRGQLG